MAEWIVAVAGAAAMVAVGAISATDAALSVARQWNVLFFFLGLMTTAAVAEQSGVLALLTTAAFRLGRARQRDLFLVVCGLCVLVTATLSNDATILLLTPLILRTVTAVGAPVLPYAFVCAYLANASSALLPIANPANVIVLESASMTLGTYVRYLAAPSIAAIVATVSVVAFAYRRPLAQRLAIEDVRVAEPHDARFFAIGIVAVLATYLAALELAIPIGPVAATGGAALLLALILRHDERRRDLLREIEWGIFPFFAALVVIVSGAARAGLVDAASAALRELGAGSFGPVLVGVATTLAANAMNNLPAAVMTSAALEHGGSVDPSLVSAVILGIDIGPNFTTLGSIATLLWLMQLRRRGIAMTQLAYLRASAVPSAAALGAALATLALLR